MSMKFSHSFATIVNSVDVATQTSKQRMSPMHILIKNWEAKQNVDD